VKRVLSRRPSALLAAVALAVASAFPSPARAAPPVDGFYGPSEAGVPVPGADATEVRLGERLELRVLSARVAARDNTNEAFDASVVVPYDARLSTSGVVLVAGGHAFRSNGAGSSGTETSHVNVRAPNRTHAEALARLLGVELTLRQHPRHALDVRFVPDRDVYRPGEPVKVTLRIRNVGERAVAFQVGGRNRGRRDNQFAFAAVLGVNPVPDVGDPTHFGGLSVRRRLAPGETFEKEVPLRNWFALRERGHYTVVGAWHLDFLPPEAPSFEVLWEDWATGEFTFRVDGAPFEGALAGRLPEDRRYAVPVAGQWLDPVSGETLGACEGPSQWPPTVLVDADKGLYRRGEWELDARARTARKTDAALPEPQPYSAGPVSVHGIVAVVRQAGDAQELVGTRAISGEEIFRLALPGERVMLGLSAVGPCFAVSQWSAPRVGILVHPSGRVIARWDDDAFLAAVLRGESLLVLSGQGVSLLEQDGKAAWTVPLGTGVPTQACDGGLVVLPGGDLLAWSYSRGMAWGPELARVRPSDGKAIWRATCEAFAVAHSKYTKDARVEVRGDLAYVAVAESAGEFLDVFDLTTGERVLHRISR